MISKKIVFPSSEIGIPLSDLKKMETEQIDPTGFIDAYTQSGTVIKDWLHIAADKFMELNQKFKKTERPQEQRGLRAPTTAQSPKDATWDEFHAYTLTGDRQEDAKWLYNFTLRIASGGCNCRVNFIFHIMADDSPRWSSQEAFFAWTVKMHNQVNEHVGKKEVARNGSTTKRQWTLEEARQRWGK